MEVKPPQERGPRGKALEAGKGWGAHGPDEGQCDWSGVSRGGTERPRDVQGTDEVLLGGWILS